MIVPDLGNLWLPTGLLSHRTWFFVSSFHEVQERIQNKKDDFLIKNLLIEYFLFLFLCTKNPLKNELTEILIALINIKLV